MAKVTIGGDIVKSKGVEAIKDLQENRTMIVQKLTQNPPSKPEVSESLKSIEEVFDKYKPAAEVKFSDKDGGTVPEELKFNSLADFGLGGLTENSQFLNNLKTETDVFQQILRELKGNNRLKKVLANPDSREALLKALIALSQELKDNDK